MDVVPHRVNVSTCKLANGDTSVVLNVTTADNFSAGRYVDGSWISGSCSLLWLQYLGVLTAEEQREMDQSLGK